MQNVKYMTKALLLQVAEEGDRLNLHRQIEPNILPNVTEERMPITSALPHELVGGTPTEPHYRCLVNFRLKGDPNVHCVFIDMTKKRYDSLPVRKTRRRKRKTEKKA